MNILYTCDNNYVWLMGISMISLFENNKNEREITIYFIGDSIDNQNKERLYRIAQQYNRNCYILDVSTLDVPDNLCSGRWPKSAYIRLYASTLLPKNIKKVIYLDCDTVVSGELSELWNLDIKNYMALGVRDCIGRGYKKNIGLHNSAIYVNAGVLVLNLELMRTINVSQKIGGFIEKYSKYIHYADQDILNGIFHQKIGSIHPRYNVMTLSCVYDYKEIIKLRHPHKYYDEKVIVDAVKEPIVIHYTTNMRIVRPWYNNSNHPYKEYFLKYFYVSPWKEKGLDEYEFYTKESKVIGLIQKLPNAVSYTILGIIHSKILPKIIKIKGKMRRG